MSRITDDVKEAIRQAVDITDLVGRYVPLKKSGRSFKGCCPFHDEKTPSFHVWAETSTWKCFGCGRGGDLFRFLMEREGMTFPEALRQLAREAGIELQADSPEAARRASHLQRLRELNEWACRFFESALRGPRGEPARAYFKRRGIVGETALEFRLGYAPPGWDNLLRAATDGGWSEDELVEAGLVIRREAEGERTKIYDRFRDRVVFPIADPQGRVIAFGARTLGDGEPKYLNSPETPLFTKGEHLYALHLAKRGMMKTGEGAVMEGYTDVLLAHQAGWPVAVAGLGTALTDLQATRLARYVKRLWLVYDGDAAGRRAAEKAIPGFLAEDVETRVALLSGGKDPADIVVEGGVAALREALDGAPDAFEHLLAACSGEHDVATVPGRAAATEAALEALTGVTDAIRRSLYVKRLADALGVPEDAATERLAELTRARKGREARSAARAAPHAASSAAPPAPSADDPPLDAYAGAMASADGEDVDAGPAPATQPATGPLPPAERLLLEALVGCPTLLAEVPEAGTELLSHTDAAELVGHLLALAEDADTPIDGGRIVGSIDDARLQSLAVELLATGDGKELEQQGRDCLRRLEDAWHRRRVHERVHAASSEEEEIEALRALQEVVSAQHRARQ